MMATSSTKKTFDFRMSKKVAELTQVVHMLFIRNHEKEVEIEALKDAYEEEIRNVIDDAQSRIQKLQTKIEELELYRYNSEQAKELKRKEECMRHEAELNAQIQDLMTQLRDEKSDCQSSRDLLIRAQHDLQDLRQTHADDVGRLTKLLDERDRQVAQLTNSVFRLEKEVHDKDSLLDSKGELLRTHEKLRRDLDQLSGALQAAEKHRDELSNRNRLLEGEVKSLRRTLSKRGNERHSAKTNPPIASGYTGDYNEEVEQLRRELLRYKMELSNREHNFNRVFSEKQPINTEGPFMKRAQQSFGRAVSNQEGFTALRLTRERTYGGEHLVNPYSENSELRHSPRSVASATAISRRRNSDRLLPQLMESNRLQKLVKPRPLPREILSGKEAAGAR